MVLRHLLEKREARKLREQHADLITYYEDYAKRQYRSGFDKGLKQGIDQGFNNGIDQGLKLGLERGIKQGRQMEREDHASRSAKAGENDCLES